MENKLLKVFSPSCRKQILLLFMLYGLEVISYYLLYKYNISEIIFYIHNYLNYILLFNSGILLITIIYCFYLKTFNKYYIYQDKIIARTGILKNTIIVHISNLMIINSYQNIPQFLLGLITVTIEADGDPNSPEIIMKDIPANIYEEYIMNFRHR